MDNTVIVTTSAQLREIITEQVNSIFSKLVNFQRKDEPVETDGMDIKGASKFLTDRGIPTARATLYQLVYKKEIPYQKVGKRVLFSRKELLQWIEGRTVRPETKSDASLRIVNSVNRKTGGH